MTSGRRSRDEASQAEERAVRLSARGLTDREIGVALDLSESEARRKRKLGLARRRQQQSEDGEALFAATEAELEEVLRTAYRDHDDAPGGSPARVGALKVITDLIMRRSRLRGIDLERPALALLPAPQLAESSRIPDEDRRDLVLEAEESLRVGARAAIELGLQTTPGDVRPPTAEPTEEVEV